MKVNSARNPVISLSRVLGMIFIILCHIIGYYSFIPGASALTQFFISGVQLFIFISGYLYGGKTISQFKKWFCQRACLISLPAIILSIIVILSLLIAGEQISTPSIIAYCLDLEGLLFLIKPTSLLFKSVPSLDPLWFTTVIMLCYLLIPLLQKIKLPSTPMRRTIGMIIFLLIGTAVCCILFPIANFTYFFFFTIGYFLGKVQILDKIGCKSFILYTLAFITAVLGRLLLHVYFDGSLIYEVYAEFARFVIGTWFIVALSFIHLKSPSICETVAGWGITKWFDAHSFYIYLTHGIFCMGAFNLYEALPWPLATVAFFIAAFALAIALKWLCQRVTALFHIS